MGKFFNLDNPVFQGINKLVDCLFLSVLWVLFSIPVITIGASTSAAYATATKVLRHDRGYVFRQFWTSFKSSFKQATIAWVIYVVLALVLVADTRLMGYFLPEGTAQTIFKAVFFMMLFIMVMVAQYLFPYIARFELGLKHIALNSLLIAIRHLPWTILLVLISAAAIFLGYLIPLFIFIMPCVWALLASLILERIFRRYMSEEDRAKEEKLNSREYL